ncbi:MAG: pilus assembly protein [Candidatus Dormibacteraeota bacterium]|nr:pilus assembly protein [Candidatus Dormibacteraeota bacterium]
MRPRRRRRRSTNAQAVLETALVVPIMLLLACNFIAVMLQVSVQQQLDSATALAAESRFQAPEGAFDPGGAACCPDPRCCASSSATTASLSTSGLPTGCRYAAETFYGTMTGDAALLRWQTAPLCLTGGDSARAAAPYGGAVAYPGSPTDSDVSCVVGATPQGRPPFAGYLDRTLNPPSGLSVVTCDATATLDFSRTPLAWGVFWDPTLHAHAEAVPPPFRQ